MSTGRWSELSAEHEVRYTGNGRSFTIAMSKTSGVTVVFMGYGSGVRSKDKTGDLFAIITEKFPPSRD